MTDLLTEAIEALGINVPITKHKIIDDKHIELWLYGGDGTPIGWTPDPHPAKPVNFTEINGVGVATNRALHQAGITTWHKLRQANDETLLAIVSPRALASIRDYFRNSNTQHKRSNL